MMYEEANVMCSVDGVLVLRGRLLLAVAFNSLTLITLMLLLLLLIRVVKEVLFVLIIRFGVRFLVPSPLVMINSSVALHSLLW